MPEQDPTPVQPPPALPPAEGDTQATVPPSSDPLLGREVTMQAMPAKGIADLSGREVTMQTPGPGGAFNLTGREATMGVMPAAGPADLSGREVTMQTPTGGTTDLSGREVTMQTPTGGTTDLSGREVTMQTPTGGTTDLSGREMTLQTESAKPATDPGRPKTEGRSVTRHTFLAGTGTPTPATMVGGARPNTGSGTSIAFDDAWHLAGRKGQHTGQTWGDFELGGILGEGGMGAVYRAKQKSLKRRVAIKVLPPNLAQDSKLLQRFQLEASTSSKLQSPHVVQVYAIGENDGNHYYAMEFVEGTDLYDIIKKRKDDGKKFTSAEALDYILQAAKGLAEAGRHGVVHRDIKPPNLMVTKGGLVKITDFGIVKVIGEHNLTMTGQAVGTPAYVSPEQGRGDADVDCRSDLYSLGVVFYELLAMQKPFSGTTPNALIYQHCYEEPPLPKTINAEVTDECQAVAMKCLQKKQENRYQSADELVRDLEMIKAGALMKEALAQFKLGTGADEAKREQMNWFQRNMVKLAIAAGLVVVAGGGGGYWAVTSRAEATRQREMAELEAKKKEELARIEKRLGGEQAKEKRKSLQGIFAAVTSLPPDARQQLADFAALIGEAAETDKDLKAWRSKLAAVEALQAKIKPLETQATPAQRAQGRDDLREYYKLVSNQDPLAVAITRRLDDLDTTEREARAKLSSLETVALRQSTRQEAGQALARLKPLVAGEDTAVADWTKRCADFDAKESKLLAQLTPLDKETSITEAKRIAYQEALTNAEVVLDADRARVAAWKAKLDQSGKLVAGLRRQIGEAFGQGDWIRPAQEARAAAVLAEFRKLVNEDDNDLKSWDLRLRVSTNTRKTLKEGLGEYFTKLGDGAMPVNEITARRNQLEQYARVVDDGDPDLAGWTATLRAGEARVEALRKDLQALSAANSELLSLARQKELGDELKQARTLGALDFDTAAAYEKRLALEAERVVALRKAMAAGYDATTSLTPALLQGLAQLVKDVGDTDPELRRWLRKRDRVAELQKALGVIDLDGKPIPEGATTLFDELKRLIGADDPDIKRWQAKVERVRELTARLAPLDEVRPVPPEAAENLDRIRALVGDQDQKYISRRRKLDEIGALKGWLRRLPDAITLGAPEHHRAHRDLVRLLALVGRSDADAAAWADRLAVLDGPERPVWAVAADGFGRDEFGVWAVADIGGQRVKFRFAAPGAFWIGAAAGEDGAEADEVRVRMGLSRALWVADSEMPQNIWEAITGSNPSLNRGPLRPVERVSAPEAEEFLRRIAQPGLALRLPTEVEWEYVTRAGEGGAWSSARVDARHVDAVAWFGGNSDGQSHDIKGRYPNPLGLYDTHGNVWEWCADAYAPYPTSETTDHRGTGIQRSVRGGSWGDSAANTRAANRKGARPDLRSAYVGFRPVAEVEWPGGRPPTGDAMLARDTTIRRGEVKIGGATIRLEVAMPAAMDGEAAAPAQPATAALPAAPVIPAPILVPEAKPSPATIPAPRPASPAPAAPAPATAPTLAAPRPVLPPPRLVAPQ